MSFLSIVLGLTSYYEDQNQETLLLTAFPSIIMACVALIMAIHIGCNPQWWLAPQQTYQGWRDIRVLMSAGLSLILSMITVYIGYKSIQPMHCQGLYTCLKRYAPSLFKEPVFKSEHETKDHKESLSPK